MTSGKTKLTVIEAAALKGVTASAIRHAGRRGTVIIGSDKKLDLRRRVNREYFEVPARTRLHPAKSQAPAKKPSGKPRGRLDAGLRVVLTRSEVETRKKLLECEKLELQNARTRGELIPMQTAQRTVSDLGEILRTSLLYLPRRASAHVLALAQSGADGHQVEEHLAVEVAKAVADFKTAAVRRLEEHLAELEQQEQQRKDEMNGASG